MPELLSRLDFYQIGRNYVLTRARRIDPAQVDVEGSDINLFVGSQSFCAHAVSRQLGARINALLLDGAEREDLDRYAYDRYQLTRKAASSALGTVRFYRTSAAAGGGDVPIGQKLRSLTGIEYITITPATFGASSLEATAFVRAVQAGREFQVGRNQIRSIDNVGALFDPSLRVNNDDPTAGGNNREEDDVFRERIREFWTRAQRGTLQAIVFGARTVGGVESAIAQEVIDEIGRPARLVELFIADSSGVASQALANEVDDALEEWRAAGIFVDTRLSSPEIIDIALTLTFVAGVDTVTLTEEIRNAIVVFVNSLPVGATLLRNDLASVLARFRNSGLIPNEGSITVPTGDLVPSTGRTIRTTLDKVTA